MRRRLDRRRLLIFPCLRVSHALCVLLAVGLRTLWNGWVAACRPQHREAPERRYCLFGCDAPDEIEHYSSCSAVSDFAASYLGLRRAATPPSHLAEFFSWTTSAPVGDLLIRKALRTAAVYQVHNLWRHRPALTPAAALVVGWQPY